MKTCSKCQDQKPEDQFNKKRSSGLQPLCRLCQKSYADAYYQANKIRLRARLRITTNQLRQARRDLLDRLKSRPCADCGGKFNPWQMDFDHVRGRKLFNVAVGAFNVTEEKLLVEIDKCDVVCANCHRQRTHERQ